MGLEYSDSCQQLARLKVYKDVAGLPLPTAALVGADLTGDL